MVQAEKKAYPFINFGKMFTQVTTVYYDKSKDALSLTTTLPKAAPENIASLELPEGVTTTYNKLNGDPQQIFISKFQSEFLARHKNLSASFLQIDTGRPRLRRVETTPFLQGLFDWIREYAVDHQEKAPPLQWML